MLSETRDQAGPQPIDSVRELYRLTDRLFRSQGLDDVFEAALDAIVSTLGCKRASILLFDAEGVMRFVANRGLSDHYRSTLEGHTPWKPGERAAQLIVVPDIRESNEPAWIRQTIASEGIVGLAFIPLFVKGGVAGKFMIYYPETHALTESESDMALTIARQVGFSLERHKAEQERQAAVEHLRESEERFRLISDQAPVMIWLSDHCGKCLHLNKALRDFWGTGDLNLAEFQWQDTMHPEDMPAIGAAMSSALAGQMPVTIRGRYKNAEGEYRWLETDARPRFSARGEFLGMIGVNVDTTERDTLLAELNHRVKNTLSLVQSIAYQTFRHSDPDLRKAFDNRLVALSLAHNLLTQNNWGSTSLPHLLNDVTSLLVQDKSRIHSSGPGIVASPQKALALSMAFHELLTNAIKYGALSNEDGRVDIAWSIDLPVSPTLTIVWTETGGPRVPRRDKTGFGTLLLEKALSRDLGGVVNLDFNPQGLVCSISAPMSPRTGERQWEI